MKHSVKKYSIAPQLSEYDNLFSDCIPYLMYFNGRSFRGKHVSTDDHGFRTTFSNDGLPISYKEFFNKGKNLKKGVIIGGSTAFGVGATDDKNTISSILNQTSNCLWFNFSGRAFVSTQEIIIFQLFYPENLDNIVFFSGINNLLISVLSGNNSNVFTPYFNQTNFEELFNNSNKGKFHLFKYLFTKKLKRNLIIKKCSYKKRYQDLLECLSRDMKIISTLAKIDDINIVYVMQPFLPWLNKELSPEEKMLMDISNKVYPNMIGKYKIMNDHQKIYIKDVEGLCNKYKIKFINLNECDEFLSNDWLFVDRVHLTDKGYLLSSEIVNNDII